MYNISGAAYKGLDQLDAAFEAYKKAIYINPNFAEAHNNMGIILKDQGNLEEAIEAYNKALAIKPDFAEAYNNMGNALQEQGKLEEAMEAYAKSLTIKPDNADAYYNMGNALADQGIPEEAMQAYTKTLNLKPDFTNAHRNLSSIKKYTEDDDHFLQVKEISNRRDLSEDDRCNLNFALSKMHEDMGELDKSFTNLSEGNALRKKLLNYSMAQDNYLFSQLKRTQPKIFSNKRMAQ